MWCPVVPDILGNMLLLIDIGEEISKRRKAVWFDSGSTCDDGAR